MHVVEIHYDVVKVIQSQGNIGPDQVGVCGEKVGNGYGCHF